MSGGDAPPDGRADCSNLRAELDRNPAAAELFAKLDSRNRYAVLYRIDDAKKPETRARRVATFVAMLNEGKTIHPATRRGHF